MNPLYAQFETSSDLETTGIKVEYGLNNSQGKPIAFCIARAGGSNKAYQKALEKAIRPHKVLFDNGNMPDDLAEKLMLDVFCSTVLIGWENVEDREGKPLAYNQANAVKLMTDLPELYGDLRQQASKVALFRTAILEDDVKNS